MNEQLIQRIKQCPTLPTLPAVAVQVLELAQNPDVAESIRKGVVSSGAQHFAEDGYREGRLPREL